MSCVKSGISLVYIALAYCVCSLILFGDNDPNGPSFTGVWNQYSETLRRDMTV